MRMARAAFFGAVSTLGFAGGRHPAVIPIEAGTPAAPAPLATIMPNDNRRVAGRLANGVLTLRLEARTGVWQPDGPGGPLINTAAFAEVGRALETPGPLIRVPLGTEIRASIRNGLTKPMWLFGMGAAHGYKGDSVEIAPGVTRELRFKVGRVGSYYYAARTDTFPVRDRLSEDSQLGGVIIVDAPGTRVSPAERIFAITAWGTVVPTSVSGLGPVSAITFNGRSWPNNERLQLTQGDSVRWRFVNLSALDHPLHLHGFYYRVDAKGDGARDSIYADADRRMAVTEYLPPAHTMSMTFSPDRSGNWIFHCHFAGHIATDEMMASDRSKYVVRRVPADEHAAHDSTTFPKNHMTGLVIGMSVKPRGSVTLAGDVTRKMRLLVRSGPRVYGNYVGYSFVLGGSPEENDRSALKVPGPVLELIRGERVAITIVNQSHEPAAVHWHGIELESFPDGVPGVSGEGKSILPHINPGDSLTVRFTPPRAGTFMYHSHSNEFQQISSGLYGALIVRERGVPRDTTADRILLLSDGGPVINFFDLPKYPPALLNGQKNPEPLQIAAGKPTRFRLINIRADIAMEFALMDGDSATMWRIVAKDGFPATPKQSAARSARLVLGAGEVYDLEVTPRAGAALSFRYNMFGLPPGLAPTTVVPVHVR